MQVKSEDFFKSMKCFNKTFIFLTEQNWLTIKQDGDDQEKSIHFPSPVYDAILINEILVVSIRNMPIAIYKMEENEWKMQMRLHDVKQNSELFLAPLEMRKLQTNNIIGCGKGFLHEYDLSKSQIINYRCIKNYDYVSCLDSCSQNQNYNLTKNLLLLGQFNKQIKIIDTLQDKQVAEAKVHIGGITHLQFDKVDSLYFYSCARFDDYIYQWDLRNTTNFVQYYERKNQTNQRMNFDINENRQLLVGNYDGSVYIYINQEERRELKCSNSCVHSAIINDDGSCYVAYGQRSFNDEKYETGVYNFTINQ